MDASSYPAACTLSDWMAISFPFVPIVDGNCSIEEFDCELVSSEELQLVSVRLIKNTERRAKMSDFNLRIAIFAFQLICSSNF
jgi:hypothetical protein